MQCSQGAGHVNNVVYNKYAESARFNWLRNFATTIDPAHRDAWEAFTSPREVGLIMRSMKTDYKFERNRVEVEGQVQGLLEVVEKLEKAA
ncbi:hypothetical protein CTA1_2876 [Colletotrichum tanaceti]|uniref:Uncharacterized protein n=1 Tax=Colletotrichum tanaceti TaxID=1306861 RepID=A0A4U6XCM5_9PEZI|nr:hypothetical protein CTA1_2876 [Colletotrichum tanaceti]